MAAMTHTRSGAGLSARERTPGDHAWTGCRRQGMIRAIMPSTGGGIVADPLAVLTPWYAAPERPYRGSFVRYYAAAGTRSCDPVRIYHLPDHELSHQLANGDDFIGEEKRLDPEPCPVLRIPPPRFPEVSRTKRVREIENSLWEAMNRQHLPEPLIHAHGGLDGGWAAVRLARPGAKVFVTEHNSLREYQFTSRELSLYGEVIARSTKFSCVSDHLRQEFVRVFPEHAHKMRVLPPAIPFHEIPSRVEPVCDLRRWLYLGYYHPRKRVEALLEAFAVCHKDRPDLALTMAGGGPLLPALSARVAALDLQDSVTLLGGLGYIEALSLLARHDLLVYPSEDETFGLPPVEGVASGTPVLVTQCGAPEETLRDIIQHAGEMVPVSDNPMDPTELVEGYWRLTARLNQLDLPRARSVLESRYSVHALAGRLFRHYYETTS